jgi:Brp/Blh family beta-carotene 15,15'-monooxygenase
MAHPIPTPALAAPGASSETPGRRGTGQQRTGRRSPGPPSPDPRAAAALRSLTVLPVAAAVLLIAAAALAPTAVSSAALPLAVCGALLGVPHGAVDHLIPRWTGIAGPRASIALLVPAYLTVSLIAAACLLLAPGLTVVSFLLISALHFGTAETAFAAERRGESTPQPRREPRASCAHGAAGVGLLLWAHPDDAGAWLRRLSPGAADAVAAAAHLGLAVTVALIAGSLLLALLHRQYLAVTELAVIVVLFTCAPALAAFGVYFGGWHSLRHTGRLLDVARAPADPGWRPAVNRLARASLLPTGAALTAIAGLILAHDHAPLLAEVAVLLAVTYPHTAAVWSADTWRHSRTAIRPPGTG